MSVLQWFVKLFLVLFLVGVVAFFGVREVLMSVATSSISDAVATLRSAHNKTLYYDVCQRKGSQFVDGVEFVKYQLRFTSSTDFTLEAECAQLEFDPILIEQKSLPQFVTKAPGSSGLTFSSDQPSGIKLEVFKALEAKLLELTGISLPLSKTKILALEGNKLVYPENEALLSAGPVTVCAGYGFECCQALTQQGVGEQITGLRDCPESCFSACVNRPSLLSFTTSPFFDPRLRKLEISNGSGVEFFYVVDGKDANQVRATVDFGDGEKADLSPGELSTSHRYQCNFAPCSYKATIELQDKWGVKSEPSSISQVQIEVL